MKRESTPSPSRAPRSDRRDVARSRQILKNPTCPDVMGSLHYSAATTNCWPNVQEVAAAALAGVMEELLADKEPKP